MGPALTKPSEPSPGREQDEGRGATDGDQPHLQVVGRSGAKEIPLEK